MTEKEKMLAGKLYDPSDKELSDLRIKAHKLSKMFNDTFEDEEEKRATERAKAGHPYIKN